jgi:hypothetical protein
MLIMATLAFLSAIRLRATASIAALLPDEHLEKATLQTVGDQATGVFVQYRYQRFHLQGYRTSKGHEPLGVSNGQRWADQNPGMPSRRSDKARAAMVSTPKGKWGPPVQRSEGNHSHGIALAIISKSSHVIRSMIFVAIVIFPDVKSVIQIVQQLNAKIKESNST